MEVSTLRNKVLEEIKRIPENKLTVLYDFLHYFRLGLQNAQGNADHIMKFAGCWKDMPEEVFTTFSEDIAQRRRQAFSRRRRGEASTG